ncbi:unnamed protein product, partial [Mesorhabditis spiculigera]
MKKFFGIIETKKWKTKCLAAERRNFELLLVIEQLATEKEDLALNVENKAQQIESLKEASKKNMAKIVELNGTLEQRLATAETSFSNHLRGCTEELKANRVLLAERDSFIEQQREERARLHDQNNHDKCRSVTEKLLLAKLEEMQAVVKNSQVAVEENQMLRDFIEMERTKRRTLILELERVERVCAKLEKHRDECKMTVQANFDLKAEFEVHKEGMNERVRLLNSELKEQRTCHQRLVEDIKKKHVIAAEMSQRIALQRYQELFEQITRNNKVRENRASFGQLKASAGHVPRSLARSNSLPQKKATQRKHSILFGNPDAPLFEHEKMPGWERSAIAVFK